MSYASSIAQINNGAEKLEALRTTIEGMDMEIFIINKEKNNIKEIEW